MHCIIYTSFFIVELSVVTKVWSCDMNKINTQDSVLSPPCFPLSSISLHGFNKWDINPVMHKLHALNAGERNKYW